MHQSPPERLSRAGVVQINYDIVKAPGGELKVETREQEDLPAEASAKVGSEFINRCLLSESHLPSSDGD